MKPAMPFKMADSDIEAILAALPIVENISADSPNQQFMNRMCCQAVRQKITAGRKDFSQNELRVIAAAVCYAAEYLSGRMPQLATLIPDTSVIRQYALSYVQLSNYFLPQIFSLDDHS